jgi:hypothetical protein
MNHRLSRAKSRGQSIPIIALIIVVLFGMVGLAVDVGNTYAANRNAVRATNAATLAGMDKLIKGGSDEDIATVIAASFRSNGIDPMMSETGTVSAGQRRVKAVYLDSNGNPLLSSCWIGNCGAVPANVQYIQIQVTGTVDTYFARIVGTNTLPVKAQAFAAQCTPVNGVYPIAVNSESLGASGFLPPTEPEQAPYYGIYRDSQYPTGLYQRRIYLKENLGTSGSFNYLRWSSDPNAGSATSTQDMLSGDGNLDLGFDEVVPWPDPNSAAPLGYPRQPHQLSDGDWIYTNSGLSTASAVVDALQYHIDHRTVLNLPIVSTPVGSGNTAAVHFERMGAFYIRGYGFQNPGGEFGWYMDLVYLGPANKTACLRGNVEQGLRGLGISGQVYINPRWQMPQAPHQPIAYQMILDVSGSMNWDFMGHGSNNGSNSGPHWNCETEFANDPYPYSDQCNTPPDIWHTQSERRVYVAKNAIYNFINKMDANDTMRLIIFSSNSSGQGYASSPAGWNGNQATLRTTVQNAGMYNNDPYKTYGGTAGAQAMQQARQLLATVPSQAPNGQEYKPVVIFMTDGVSNYFLDGTRNDARDVCGSMSVFQALNTPYPCQTGTTSSGRERPITAMLTQANQMKSTYPNLALYVIGMANAPSTGLDRVASDPSMYFQATQAGVVDSILTQINAQVEGGTCTPTGGFEWLDHVDTPHLPSTTVFPDLSATTLGYMYIYEPSAGIAKYTLPIQHDPITGKLSFAIPPPDPSNPSSTGITPGNYEMAAYVGYKGDDQVSRSYDWFINPGTLQGAGRTSFAVTSASTLGRSVPLDPVFLDLRPTVRVCPTS